MEPKQMYINIEKLEELMNATCIHLELDQYSDEFLINLSKPIISNEEYNHYYLFRHKSDEIGAEDRNIYLGIFILATEKPFDSSKMVYVFKKYASVKKSILNVKKEYYLTKEEYIKFKNESVSKSDIPVTKPKLSFGKIGKKSSPSLSEVENGYSDVSNEDLNEAAKKFDEENMAYGVINNPAHLDKLSNMKEVIILGKNDATHQIHFKIASEIQNKVLGQSVKIQHHVVDDELLEFYKK